MPSLAQRVTVTPVRLSWRVLRDPARSGAANMALDHALAIELGDHEAVLRIYAWERPTVSLGRNEPARDVYSLREAEELGIDYVRRPTGGRAVLHDAELTYAVLAPPRALGGARTAYRAINAALAAALRGLGAPVSLSDSAGSVPLDAGPCFRAPVEGEVTAEGRKLVGSAQARIGGALLQHGSLILAGDQSRLARLSQRRDEVRDMPAALTELVEDAGFGDVAEAVTASMQGAFGGSWSSGGYRARELEAARRLEAERYGTDDWTWRR